LELETSELDLREAFHSIGPTFRESRDMDRRSNGLLPYLHAEAGRNGRNQESRSRIPHVEEAGQQLARACCAAAAIRRTRPDASTPPLASALQAKLGDAQAVNTFLESFRTSSTHVLAEAAALEQLGRRYPADQIKNLPPDCAHASIALRQHAIFAPTQFIRLREVAVSGAR